MLLLSSCLTGVQCRYDASSSYRPDLLESIHDKYIHLCPEVLAGLGTPRVPCEICGGSGEDVLNGTASIIDKNGRDITAVMLAGAKTALGICLEQGVAKAYLKAKSPTCGCGNIYDGSFSSSLRRGNGILSALLIQNDIEVIEVE